MKIITILRNFIIEISTYIRYKGYMERKNDDKYRKFYN